MICLSPAPFDVIDTIHIGWRAPRVSPVRKGILQRFGPRLVFCSEQSWRLSLVATQTLKDRVSAKVQWVFFNLVLLYFVFLYICMFDMWIYTWLYI